MVDKTDIAAHGVSMATILGAIAGYLPALATALAVLWYGIQIYESNTFHRLRAHLRVKTATWIKEARSPTVLLIIFLVLIIAIIGAYVDK